MRWGLGQVSATLRNRFRMCCSSVSGLWQDRVGRRAAIQEPGLSLTTSQQVCMLPLGCTAGGCNSELEFVRYCHAIGSVGPKCRNSKTSTEV